MENPWANAWGEPSKPVGEQPPTLITTRIGTHSLVSESDNDQEADLGMPSWSTGSAVIWNGSENDNALWSQPSVATDTWEPFPLPIGKVTASEHRPPSPKPYTPPDSPALSPALSPVSTSQSEEPPSLPSPADAITHRQPVNLSRYPSPPGSPDAFGTFESAATDQTWTSETVTFPDTAAPHESGEWGAAWGSSDTNKEQEKEDDDAPDEWVAAKLRKEKEDSQVPPELLSSILRHFEELSRGLWPEPDSPATSQKVSNDKDWRTNWRSGMEGVEGLTPAVNRLVPYDLTLPPSVQFMKTATSKNMVDALRLTRHITLTRSSPMAMYMASKGSTAWETSVKSRPETIQDDLPVGWRLVDKEKELSVPASTDDRGRKPGGLLSFWGRKATPSVETKRESSSSPAPVTAALSTAIPRSSTESPKIHSAVNVAPKETAPVVTPNLGVSRVTTPPIVASSTSITPDVQREPTPPPTLASRFLHRFSRAKGSSSPRQSIPLSSDGLEFSTGGVPSAGDDADDREGRDTQLNALSNMIQSSPLPTRFSPPPPKTGMSSLSDGGSGFNADLNELDSFFDSLTPSSTKANISTSNLVSLHSLPGPSSRRQSPKANKIEAKMNFSLLPAIGTPTSAPFVFPPPPSSQTPAISPVSRPPSAMTGILRPSSPPPRPASPFNIPFRSHTPTATPKTILAAKPIPPPPPPPLRSQTPRLAETQVIPSDVFDDVDFSTFHFPPPQASLTATSSFYDTSFSSTATSDRSLFSDLPSAQSTVSTGDISGFDEFDEFVSSPLRSPSPPRPPAKSSMVTMKPTPPTPPRSVDRPSMSRTPAKQVNHNRTLSLVETAAARPGQWPSPPSPLPEIIPPPRRSCDSPQPQSVNNIARPPARSLPDAHPPPPDHSRTENLLKIAAARTTRWPAPLSPLPEALPPPPNAPGVPSLLKAGPLNSSSGSSMQQQQAHAVAGMRASSSSPAIFNETASNGHRPGNPLAFDPPPRFAPPPPLPQTLSPVQLMKPPPPSAKTSMGSTVGKGGLSAQDISFFEGL